MSQPHHHSFPSTRETPLQTNLYGQIYSSYAQTIISLLDIHATPFYKTDDPKSTTTPTLEILDSGTGHGALTLHIAKAIASANPPPLNLQIPTRAQTSEAQTIDPAEYNEAHEAAQAWGAWKQTRRAVVHTVEDIAATGRHAEKIVQGFRQGLYWPHVDFHRSEVGQWVESQLAKREGKPFLSYVFLDLPNVQERLQECFTAMRDGAKVLIFVPSITQVCEVVKMIKNSQMRMTVENVVELGDGISNGRTWDVRAVTPRRLSTPKLQLQQPVPIAAEADALNPNQDSNTVVGQAGASDVEVLPTESESIEVEAVTNDNDNAISTDSEAGMSETADSSSDSESATPELPSSPNGPTENQETVMICRPKIGETIVGGGFVAVFRKMSLEEWELQHEWRKTRTGAQKKHYRS